MGDAPERTDMKTLMDKVSEDWKSKYNSVKPYKKNCTKKKPGKCKICIIAKIKV